jgi:hypothetical protein
MGKKLPIITLPSASYEAIVALYIVAKRSEAVKERDYYAGLPTVK